MKSSLRRRLSRYLILSAFVAALAASLGLWLFGELSFRASYAASEREGLENVRSRLELFDIILSRAERDAVVPGQHALIELGKRFRTREAVSRGGSEYLVKTAKDIGVGGIYFIGPDGRVFASSIPGDIGMDLFSFGPRFTASLKKLYGKGVVGDQRMTQSFQTGTLMVYQYYSPAGSDFLIEISTPIDDLLTRIYADRGYAGLVSLAFQTEKKVSESDGFVRLVDLIGDSGGSLWSLLKLGQRRDEYAPLIKLTRERLPARVEKNGIEIVALHVPLSNEKTSVAHGRRYAIIEIDRSPLFKYRLFALLTLILSCAFALAVSFVLARKAFASVITGRVEALEKAMARVADQAAPFDHADGGDDEIGSIVRGVDSLVRQVRRRAEELEALNARLSAEVAERAKRESELAKALAEQRILQREIQHRVKNNMQIILSLVGLQAGAQDDQGVIRALETTRTRLYAMSLVLDRLYSRTDIELLPLDDFLRDFTYYLDGIYRKPSFLMTVNADGGDVFLTADAAVPIGLIVGELVANSFLHAFPGRSAGRVDVVAESSGNSFRLRVSDDGIGGDSVSEGVGSTIVRALAAQLGARLRVSYEGGRTTTLEVPPGGHPSVARCFCG